MKRTLFTIRFTTIALLLVIASGCGTTRMSDTARTGTEQLLVSNAIDRAINNMDFSGLADREVYLDAQYLRGAVDEGYIISSLRQHLLANGCILKANREDAIFVVEARSGGVGTNRHDVLVGIPSFTVPYSGVAGMPSQVPEIPFAKSTHQKGVAKLAVFAYNQRTGLPVWQSGTTPVAATSRDTWVLGTGPFQRGSIYQGTGFAGSRLMLPFGRERGTRPAFNPAISVTATGVFDENRAIHRTASQPNTQPMPPAPEPGAQLSRAPEKLWTPYAPQAPGVKQPDVVSTSWSPTPQSPVNPAANAAGAPVSGGNGAGLLYLGNAPFLEGMMPNSSNAAKK